MTRDEYLKQLRNCIQALPLDEQNEAIEYYTDYFSEAGNDSEVMRELGTPEELAQTIKDKFACVPAKTDVNAKDNEQKEETNTKKQSNDNFFHNGYSSPFLKYTFNKADVKNLDISLGAAEVVVKEGSDYEIETRGINRDAFRCELSPKGTLLINNARHIPVFNFFSHENWGSWHPRVLITVPVNASVDILRLHIGAGSFVTNNISMRCNKGMLDVGAGNLVFKGLFGGSIDVQCGMGNLEMEGSISGVSNIDCGMGNLLLRLSGNPADYSCDTKIGLGEVNMNGEKKSIMGEIISSVRKINHLSINCGMGKVTVLIH